MLRKGTPFVYYGEEVGLRPGSKQVVDFRDAARTPMTWTKGGAHGFTTGKPWLDFGDLADQTSVEAEDQDPDSMLSHYRALLAFRRGHPVWSVGDERIVAFDTNAIVAFVREDAAESYFVAVGLSDDDLDTTTTDPLPGTPKLVWGEGTLEGGRLKLPAHGSAVFRLR
jgi:glycosidase